MELQFQSPQSRAQQQCHYQVPVVAKETDKPSRARSKCGGGKFVGVRQRPSGRWVAEIKDTTQKIRMWLGTFETAEEAARAYDEAACLLRGANTRTNFAAAAAPDSPVASRIRALLSHKKLEKNVPQQPAIAFSPTAYRHGCGIGSITAATSTSASTVTTTTTSVSPSSSASSATINFAMSSCVRTPILPVPAHHTVTDEEAYRSYLISGGSEEFQLASQQPWAPNASLPPREGPDMGTDNTWSAMAELEKIDPPEMESPASSHGVDRVRDQDFYDDTGNDPSDSLWDLPPICPLSCRSLMY